MMMDREGEKRQRVVGVLGRRSSRGGWLLSKGLFRKTFWGRAGEEVEEQEEGKLAGLWLSVSFSSLFFLALLSFCFGFLSFSVTVTERPQACCIIPISASD